MPDVSAKDVAALRKLTGAGMMDCKKALEENDGDLDAAKDWLRTKGKARADKRAGRSADNGAVDVVVDGRAGAVVEVNCETDFVAKSADFTAFVATLARQVVDGAGADLAAQPFQGGPDTVGDALVQLGARIGEKLELGRVARFESADGIVDAYKHVQNERGTIGVLVELGGADPSDGRAREVAHDLALHVASAAPRYVRREDVPDDVVARERAILEELTRNEGKPDNAVPKIVEGRLNGFFKDVCLVEQGFVRDPKTTVGQLVAGLGPDAAVRRFVRVKIGDE